MIFYIEKSIIYNHLLIFFIFRKGIVPNRVLAWNYFLKKIYILNRLNIIKKIINSKNVNIKYTEITWILITNCKNTENYMIISLKYINNDYSLVFYNIIVSWSWHTLFMVVNIEQFMYNYFFKCVYPEVSNTTKFLTINETICNFPIE